LYNNHLTDSSCPYLASGIRNNHTLRTLDLSWNKLMGPHFRDLVEALTTSWVEELQIRNPASQETISELKKLKELRPGLKVNI
ncbi:hypothetical protein AB205_0148690, partial [Aquarana catesbeiana]